MLVSFSVWQANRKIINLYMGSLELFVIWEMLQRFPHFSEEREREIEREGGREEGRERERERERERKSILQTSTWYTRYISNISSMNIKYLNL